MCRRKAATRRWRLPCRPCGVDRLFRFAQCFADQLGGTEQAGHGIERLAGFAVIAGDQPAFEHAVDRRLRHRQVAGAGDDHDAVGRCVHDAQLAVGRDIVDPGVGARIGHHHQAFGDQHAKHNRSWFGYPRQSCRCAVRAGRTAVWSPPLHCDWRLPRGHVQWR